VQRKCVNVSRRALRRQRCAAQGDKFTFQSYDPEVEMLVVEVWDANIGTVGIAGVGIGAPIGGGQGAGHQLIGYFAARVVELREGVRLPVLCFGWWAGRARTRVKKKMPN
jgi:hypothetical protein